MSHGIDSSIIDQIVVEVLAELRQRTDLVPNHSRGETAKESLPNSGMLTIIQDKVVTEELLKQRVKPGGAIQFLPKAILTPTAKDYLRTHRIAFSWGAGKQQPGNSSGKRFGIIVASHLSQAVKSLLAEAKQQASWGVEIESGLEAVVSRVRSIICRGEAPQAIVLSQTPHRVSCVLNRTSTCRSSVVKTPADVRAVRAELGANIICVELSQPTFVGLRETLKICGETRDRILEPPGGEP